MSDDDRDQGEFKDAVALFGRELRNAGVDEKNTKTEAAPEDGWHTTVATWPKGHLDISVWLDRWLVTPDKKRHFWFGFEGDKGAVRKLFKDGKERPKQTPPAVWNDFRDRFENEKGTRELTPEAVAKKHKGFVYERYPRSSSSSDYLGKYFVDFDVGSNGNLEKLVGEGVTFVLEFMVRAERAEAERLGLGKTECETTILTRLRQYIFRRKLVDYWGGCAVTGCATSEVLRASHIVPWKSAKDQQRLDPDNGLLLIATIDALFDKYLVSFDDKGVMLSAPTLSAEERKLLALDGMKLSKPLSTKQRVYLKQHREKAERRWNWTPGA